MTIRETINIQTNTDSKVDAKASSGDGVVFQTKAEMSFIAGSSDEFRIVTTANLSYIKTASDEFRMTDSSDAVRYMRIWYSTNEPTIPINFGKILPSFSNEEYFNWEGYYNNEEIRFYDIEWDVDIPSLIRKSQSEIDAIIEAEQKEGNSMFAEMEQEQALRQLEINKLKITNNLPPIMSDADVLNVESYIQLLQGDIDNPSGGVYNPPMPPGVTPPSYASLTVTVTRVEGWQGNLGFEVVLVSADESFTPSVLALGVYNAPDCSNYQYTTGAFTDLGDGTWGATCPAGFEPGDADVYFGLLYSGTPMSCWTMIQGQMEQTVTVIEET